MNLDPGFANFLEFLRSVEAPGSFEGKPPEMRARMTETIEKGWETTQFAPISAQENVIIGDQELSLSVFKPVVEGPGPTVLYFHPGGFILGSAHLAQDVARRLSSDLNAVVVSVDYRLAPEHQFPAAVDDAVLAAEWVRDNISRLGGDLSRILAVGESSGANLATVAALAASERGHPFAGLLLASPVTDFSVSLPSVAENASGYFLEANDLNIIREGYFGSDTELAKNPRISPALSPSLSLMPPTIVGVAGFDPLRDDGIVFAGKLLQNNVAATLRVYPGLIHPFFGMPGVSEGAEFAVSELTTLLSELSA